MKIYTGLACYNSDIHEPSMTISGRNVTSKIDDPKLKRLERTVFVQIDTTHVLSDSFTVILHRCSQPIGLTLTYFIST